MFCSKCGKEIADGSVYCSFCGAKIIRAGSRANRRIVTVGAVIGLLAACAFGVFEAVKWYDNYRVKNPVLNSPSDITDELIRKILANSLESLTVNYEFTRCKGEKESDDDWLNEQNRINPFWKVVEDLL